MGNIYMRFPEGKRKTLTLSYDDGVEQDLRLINIMKKYGLKGSFNINSGMYGPEGIVYPEGQIGGNRMSKSKAKELYLGSGMEVAVHGLHHPYLDQLPINLCIQEVVQDRINLEKDYGCIVRGMAYPFGTYSESVENILRQCGIVYARTTISTEKFDIPKDWLQLSATCHHRNPRLMELAQMFVDSAFERNPGMFYLWGHSFEFDKNIPNNNWGVIEEFAEYMGNREDIWYATNIEIYDYCAAYKQLIFSIDFTKVYNPTCTALYFETNKGMYCVNPGETVQYEY